MQLSGLLLKKIQLKLISFVLLGALCLATSRVADASGPGERPIVGILSQQWRHGNHNSSYIASSYVKLIESGGARVVPIEQGLSDIELLTRFSAVNGILLPGGGQLLRPGSPFYDDTKRLLDLAQKANDGGDFFPILAICLGMEAIVKIISQSTNILSQYNSEDSSSVLIPRPEAQTSRFLNGFRAEVLQSLYEQPLARQSHKWGLSPDAFLGSTRLTEFFNILSLSKDDEGKEYVSMLEAKKYPFTLIQWHPEKNAFEFGDKWHIPHSSAAVAVTQEVARVFVDQTRVNAHKPASLVEEDELLIYNYQSTFTGKHSSEDDRSTFDQVYIFPQPSQKGQSNVLEPADPNRKMLATTLGQQRLSLGKTQIHAF